MKEIISPDPFLFKLLPKAEPREGVTYVPSQFSVPFSCDGKSYVINFLTKQLLEAELPERVRAGEGFDSMIETFLLVPEGKNECAFYESISALARLLNKKEEIRGYVILPTLHCNARCVYCYEEGRPQSNMSLETAEASLKFILAHYGSYPVKISWFGGEPTLRTDIIDFISAGLRDAGVEYRSSVVSNGSLITPAILEKMKGLWHTRSIQISMDGAEQDYYARKRYVGGSGQYRSVMENISRLSEAGITVALRVNVDEGNWPGIPRFMEDLKQGVENKENVLVYFSPLMAVRAGEGELTFWNKVLAARPLITEAGFRPLGYTDPVMRFRITRCMADSGSAVIGPDGSLYPCEHCPPEALYGDVFRGVTNEAARHEFCRTDRTREMCRDCPMLPDCTSFASCPWVDSHCRESHLLLALSALRRMIRRAGETAPEEPEEKDFVC